MCPPGFIFAAAPFVRRVARPVVKYRRIYAFAANRWADAKSPEAMRFWKGVMDSCVKTVVEFKPLSAREFWEGR